MSREKIERGFMSERKCSVCGRLIYGVTSEWVYKVPYRKDNKRHKLQCSYSCWCKAGGNKGYGITHGQSGEGNLG